MIDSGKRVVVFLDAGADGSDGGTVPYILTEFPMVRSFLRYYRRLLSVHRLSRYGKHRLIQQTVPSRAQWIGPQDLFRQQTTCI